MTIAVDWDMKPQAKPKNNTVLDITLSCCGSKILLLWNFIKYLKENDGKEFYIVITWIIFL